MAEAIREVAALHTEGTIEKPVHYPEAFPSIFGFQQPSVNPAEEKLPTMFLCPDKLDFDLDLI